MKHNNQSWNHMKNKYLLITFVNILFLDTSMHTLLYSSHHHRFKHRFTHISQKKQNKKTKKETQKKTN